MRRWTMAPIDRRLPPLRLFLDIVVMIHSNQLSEDAIESWRLAIKTDTFSRYHYEMGRAIVERGESLEAAGDHLSQALSLAPDMVEACLRLHDLLVRQGRTHDAERLAADQARVMPEWRAVALCRLGMEAHRGDHAADAERHWAEATAQAPGDDTVRAYGMLRALLRKDWTDAKRWTDWNTVRPRDQEELVGALLARETAFAHASDMDACIFILEQTLRIDKENAQLHARLGSRHLFHLELESAEKNLQSALAIDDSLARVYGELGMVRFHQGRREEAEAHFAKMIALSPEANHDLWSRFLLISGDGDRAITEIDRLALGKTAQDPVQLDRAQAYHVAGRLNEALDIYRAALRSDPNSYGAHGYLGLALLSTDDPVAGEAHLRQASEIAPGQSWIMTLRGLAAQRLGNLEEAVAWHRQSIESDPNSPWPYTDLALALSMRGEEEEALDCHRKAIERSPATLWFASRLRGWAWDRLVAAYDKLDFTRTAFWPSP